MANLNTVSNDGQTAVVKSKVGEKHYNVVLKTVTVYDVYFARPEYAHAESSLHEKQKQTFKVIRNLVICKQPKLCFVSFHLSIEGGTVKV